MVVSRAIIISPIFLLILSIISFLLGGIGGIVLLSLALFVYPQYGTILLASTLIFQRLLVLDIGGNSLWFLLATLYLLVFYNNKSIKVPKEYFYSLVVSVLVFSLTQKYILLVAIIKIFVLYLLVNKSNSSEFLTSYFFSIVFFLLFGYFSPVVDFWNGNRLSIEPLTNSNIFGIHLTLALLVMWSIKSIPLIYFGFLTKSRTFLVGLLLVVIKKYKRKSVLLIPIVIIFLLKFSPEIFERILNPRQGDITGGRAIIWQYYYNYLLSNPSLILLGGDILDIMAQSPLHQAPHNFILEGIINYGIIGLVILFVQLKILSRLNLQSYVSAIWIPITIFISSHDFFNLSSLTFYFLYVKQSREVALAS